jgi:hypothetical protein
LKKFDNFQFEVFLWFLRLRIHIFDLKFDELQHSNFKQINKIYISRSQTIIRNIKFGKNKEWKFVVNEFVWVRESTLRRSSPPSTIIVVKFWHWITDWCLSISLSLRYWTWISLSKSSMAFVFSTSKSIGCLVVSIWCSFSFWIWTF